MAEIHEIVRAYRTAQKLSLRDFAQQINQNLINTVVSYGTVHRWEDTEKPYEPDMWLLFECLAMYQDWRSEWAAACLKAMWPDLFNRGVVCVNLPNNNK